MVFIVVQPPNIYCFYDGYIKLIVCMIVVIDHNGIKLF